MHVAEQLVAEAARIERERNGRALTDAEAQTLKAVGFLRVIAPYLFDAPPAAGAVDPVGPAPAAQEGHAR